MLVGLFVICAFLLSVKPGGNSRKQMITNEVPALDWPPPKLHLPALPIANWRHPWGIWDSKPISGWGSAGGPPAQAVATATLLYCSGPDPQSSSLPLLCFSCTARVLASGACYLGSPVLGFAFRWFSCFDLTDVPIFLVFLFCLT